MEKRNFLKSAGLAAGAIVAAPSVAVKLPTLNWRCASAFPKSLDILYGGSEYFSKRVYELSDGKITIRAYPAGEMVPALQVLDAVQNETLELGHTPLYFYFGKDPTFAFETTIPFGLNSRQQTAWYVSGGGRELYLEFLKKYNIINLPCGNTGCQMGGWFGREVKKVEDLQGLKMRVGGYAGRILQKLGLVPQGIAPGDIYTALEKGTIDACEFVGPYDDEKLGFNRVAPFYYTPGWYENSSQTSILVNSKKWESLPNSYKAIFKSASYEAHVWVQSQYDTKNPQALARLLKRGTKLRTFSKSILDACKKATIEVINEDSEKNPSFKKIYNHYARFQFQQNQWYSVAEYPMLRYQIESMQASRRKS
tara:strand:- start:620 stop:1717 length:1098 start_codon:yes stop_codon:yes gene_type:complete